MTGLTARDLFDLLHQLGPNGDPVDLEIITETGSIIRAQLIAVSSATIHVSPQIGSKVRRVVRVVGARGTSYVGLD